MTKEQRQTWLDAGLYPFKSMFDFIDKLNRHDGEPMECYIALSGGIVRASHNFTTDGETIFDYSLVDDSETEYTLEEFQTDEWYLDAIAKSALIGENITDSVSSS